MADITTTKDTSEPIALGPTKGPLKAFFDFFGGKTLRLHNDLGAMAIFFFRSFSMIFRLKAIPDIIQQIYFIGAKSAQIVMLVGFFTAWCWACSCNSCWSNSVRSGCWAPPSP
jgi:ABC-type transporter Mla maintaining outer membrane lipid asymmetry permease subunit MlaE